MYWGNNIKSFCEISYWEFKEQSKKSVKEEIENKDKDYILNVDEEDYLKYLRDTFTFSPLKVLKDTEFVGEPKTHKEIAEDPFCRVKYEREYYEFTIQYNFEGSAILFKVQPNPRTLTTYDINVDEYRNTVSFKFKLIKKDAEEYNREKSNAYHHAFTNLNKINDNLPEINSEILTEINKVFNQRKAEYRKENDFFSAINIKVNENTKAIFTAPTIKKKDIPQPVVSSKKKFTSEPSMGLETYNDTLDVIYNLGKRMEQKPSLYQNKEEEHLRDYFIMFLETRYEATTATGETFNRGGKTDIILKHADDGSNLFVAECKYWHGKTEFLNAIHQLFDRYLTWRDSKTALVLFVTNKDFTNVLNTIKTEIKTHPYYVRENGVRGESSFSYIFHLPQDENKEVYFEVIAFHFDKQA